MQRTAIFFAVFTGVSLAVGCATPVSGSSGQVSALRQDLKDQQSECAAQTAQGTDRLKAMTAANVRLREKLAEEINRGRVTINLLDDQLRLSVQQEVLFDSGSTELRQEGLLVLDQVGGALLELTGQRVTVEGHTDDVQIGQSKLVSFPTNWELSTARATTVVRYLQDKGIRPERLGAAGFGEYRPISSNATAGGRQANRRIEVVLAQASGQR